MEPELWEENMGNCSGWHNAADRLGEAMLATGYHYDVTKMYMLS